MLPLKSLAKQVRSKIERRLYAGKTVQCTVCGARSRSWLRGRDYGRCPACRCASRTRVMWRYLKATFPSPGALRALHFAPEAPLRAQLREWGLGSYATCDLRAPNVDHNVDIQRMPFQPESFDLVLCSHVLEHVPDHRAAMRELRRVCTRSGQVLIAVPIDRATPTREDLSDSLSPQERKRLFGEIDHLRFFGLDIIDMLKDAGFDVKTHEPARDVVIVERHLEGLGPEEVLFICTPS